MKNVRSELGQQFRSGDMVTKLIIFNLFVFLGVVVWSLFLFLNKADRGTIEFTILNALAPTASWEHNLTHPWSIVLYMFTHTSIMHILFNMLMLHFSGRLFLNFLDEKKLLNTYIFGGLTGLLIYIVSFNVFPVFEGHENIPIIGASASVMALLVAVAFRFPSAKVYFFGVFEMKIIYLAFIFILVDLFSISRENPGGHLSHLGGAIYGAAASAFFSYSRFFLNTLDITLLFSPGRWFSRRTRMKVVHTVPKRPISDEKYNDLKVTKQQRIDQILDKINKSGYESLSKEEKDFLYKASKDV
jgi:membrane associated rhomboid family serine protease